MKGVGIALAAAGLALGGCAAPGAAPNVEPRATVRQIMFGITVPTSDIVWAAGAEEPTTDEQWTTIETNAMALAESGNLLLMRSLGEEWRTHSLAMIAASQRAGVAAAAHDLDALLTAGDELYESCAACHQAYMPQ